MPDLHVRGEIDRPICCLQAILDAAWQPGPGREGFHALALIVV
jgi:hypothetical protein